MNTSSKGCKKGGKDKGANKYKKILKKTKLHDAKTCVLNLRRCHYNLTFHVQVDISKKGLKKLTETEKVDV